ncbi:hypothetical protein HGC74_001755 [Campylobacter coli]|uniref:hypothetical protein n=1 Tax=Campylobacter coli TaxID=195 RepID=UPI0008F47834|nr:hypothetical protein [Campylobacter coli]APA57607.1 hypothetical protein BLD33_03795 [Campylobacter coli]EAJ1483404.1 hypothetical protein [Campylobacter coli]EAJ4082442.1 hypothetical protein [Campylobacter coli]EAJ9523430.1 hypothetical protein [Campylobacter coli]EAK3643653.1 hypothetical protein [Campylobacter coli]
MSNTNVDYNKRLKAFKEIYPQILEMSLAEKSPFGEFKKLLEQFGNDNVIRNDQQFQSLAQALVSVGQTIVAQSQNTALQMILGGDENIVNQANINLTNAQTETEKANANLVKRQTAQIDDELELKEQSVNIDKSLSIEKEKLLQAQTETEKAKPALIDRQTAQIDDNLRIEAAKVTQNVQFGYCAGGLDIPQEIMKLVKEKIKNIEKFS